MHDIKQYQKVQVMTSDRVRIIVMLCEGVIRFNKLALKAIKEGDVEGRNNFINRSLAIISELNNALDMEKGGEVAFNLARLYDYSTYQLTEANIKSDPDGIEAVTRVFMELKAGWEGIINGKVDSKENKTRTTITNSVSYGI